MVSQSLWLKEALWQAETWVQIAAGLSLLFLSQTRIYNTLNQVVFQQLRTSAHRFFATPLHQGAVGVVSALFLQTSRISTRITSELVKRRILSLRQGFLVILGAGLGSSLKSLLFAGQLEMGVALFFLLSGVGAYLLGHKRFQFLSAPLIAAGCFWASLTLIWQGVSPFFRYFLSQPQILDRVFGITLPGQFLLTLSTVICLLFVRTGTLFVFAVLQLAWLNLVSLEAGSAILLGVNLALGLFSLHNPGKSSRVGQLVWSHAINRIFCGLLILFFFPYLHRLLMLLPMGPNPVALAYRLAILHILINFLMGVSGFYGFRIFQRVARWIHPGNDEQQSALVLSPKVRLMLQQAPDFAQQEVNRQIAIALEQVKRLTDLNLRMLSEKKSVLTLLQQEQYMFETIQHTIYDLLLPIYPARSKEKNNVIQALRVIDYSSQLYLQAYQLYTELFQGLSIHQFRLPELTDQPLEAFLKEFNELWLVILLERPGRPGGLLENRLEALEDSFFDALSTEGSAQQVWGYRVMGLLRQQSIQLYQLYCEHVSAEAEKTKPQPRI